jgi:hypothetical protein
VAGVALLGFHLSSLDTLVYEQTVHRPTIAFLRLDEDSDQSLSPQELQGEDPLKASLRSQMPVLDLNGDHAVSLSEYQGGNLSNLVIRDLLDASYRKEEAALPRPAEILRDLDRPVLFFQGEWDNQCPALNVRAVELVARHVWKDSPAKASWRFHYFPGLGHALDRRDAPDDLLFRPMDSAALQTLSEEMERSFR